MTDEARRQALAKTWTFPWNVMDVLIGGRSSIDIPELTIETWDEATAFLRTYGFDPERTKDLRFMHAIIVESLNFIEKFLIPEEWAQGLEPPPEVLLCEDPRYLLQFASSHGRKNRNRRRWACAVLRLMHTIAHIEGVQRSANISYAREQIMDRFAAFIHRDAEGLLWFGSADERVRLERLDWKTVKSRESIILKLLHKPANVAETIYDLLGLRIVTTRLCDVMLVVKYLRHFHMVSFPNCHPSRARNTLIDLEHFQGEVETLREMLVADELTPEEFEAMLTKLTAPVVKMSSTNPHSAANYRSVQLTCRQLIRYPNPMFGWLPKLKAIGPELGVAPTALQNLVALIEGWQGVKAEEEVEAFFPFEVQIMDREAYAENQCGDAAHDRYKLAQVHTARKRVLGDLLSEH